MAPRRAKNPGKTSRYYQSKKGRKSYEKQKRKQKKINSTAAKKRYRRLLAIARRKRGIMGKGGKDVTKSGTESVKKNRGRGGAKRK